MKKWFKILTAEKDPTRAEVVIYDRIGKDFWGDGSSVEAKKFREELLAHKAKGVETIVVRINSDGGSVFEGLAMYNILKDSGLGVEVRIDGLAASIASVVAMAGDVVIMPENTFMMIHGPSGVQVGKASDMRTMADLLDTVKGGMVSAYRDKSKMDEAAILAILDDPEDTWLTAKEAVAMGLADQVIQAVEITACADMAESLKQFRNVPESLMAQLVKPKNKGEKKMEITLAMLKKDHGDIVAAIQKEGADSVDTVVLVADAKKAGAKEERERIQAVQAQAIPGHEALLAGLMFDGVTSGPEAAVKVLQAEKKIRETTLNAQAGDAPETIQEPVAPDAIKVDSTLPAEEQARTLWKNDPKIRAEWAGAEEDFVAYFKAEAGGQIKIQGRKE